MRYHVVRFVASTLVCLLFAVAGCGDNSEPPPVDADETDGSASDAAEDCDGGSCAEPTCTDGVENGTETDIDCGGACAPGRRCGDGLGCAAADDCQSGVCTGQMCAAPACGDGVRQGDEACDDGNHTNGDGCDDGAGGSCRPSGCGNGTRSGSEQCDDGNNSNGDGCDNNCTTTACGNGVITSGEVCDDSDAMDGDGCSATCQVESGFTCSMVPSVCVGMCGDGVRVGTEQCDDAPPAENGDGCSITCTQEPGYTCTGAPSVCTTSCGDGVRAGTEGCDDAPPAEGGDGCNATCFVEPGWVCVGTPSLCFPICGDGRVVGGEACDDQAPAENGDGCSASCTVESGYTCGGSPSTCTPICGDGVRLGSEACDDAPPADDGDGCSATCTVEAGWTCMGSMPSTCTTTCGDGIRAGAEECDDAAPAEDGDGCSATCTVETGYTCMGFMPSTCAPVCGDGLVRPGEGCDDAPPADDGDGCNAMCQVELGYVCTGEPSTCEITCGDGDVDPGEGCDDGDNDDGDGCSAACVIELGYACAGTAPSVCTSTCGDGVKASDEACDDAAPAEDGDGCSATCTIENGWTCTGTMPSTCVTTCGDGIPAGTEQCDDGCGPGTPGVCDAGDNGDGCTQTCTLECGDGTLNPALEQCDDGNRVAGDGCSPTCAFEVTCGAGETLVTLSPSGLPKTINDDAGINTVTSTVTGAPIGTVRKAYVGIGRLVHDFDADLDISLISPSSVRVDLTSDNGSSSDNFIGTLFDDAATTSVTSGSAPFGGRFRPEQALSRVDEPSDGTWTFEVVDDADDSGTAHGTLESWTLLLCVDTTVVCGDGTRAGIEECDDGGRVDGDGCSSACRVEDGCGDGNIDGTEICDDDNLTPGDGCSATCTPELSCGPGEVAQFFTNNASAPITEVNMLNSFPVTVPTPGGVRKAVVYLTGITHGNTGHLDIGIGAPSGQIRNLSDDNGSGANYTQTVFDDSAATAITSGSSPFTGIFRPEATLTANRTSDLANINAMGVWDLRVQDDTSGTTGTFNSWTLGLCVDPAGWCGNGSVEPNEECDDGNTIDNDACSNLCAIADGCGDGNLDAGEECDDGNVTPGDACSGTCTLSGLDCGPGETSVFLRSNTAVPLPDNTVHGVLSAAIDVPVSGVVRRVVPSVSITHASAGDIDLWLLSPYGVQRALSTDNGGTTDNYRGTIFSDTAATGISSGSAPYSGVFKPEQTISNAAGFGNQSAAGNWVLRIADDGTAGDTGQLDRWALALCVDTSVTSVCGNGYVEAAETCDDANSIAGDGCSPTCQLEFTCAAGETRVVLRSTAPDLVIPDNNTGTGVTSTIEVAQAGSVRKAVVEIGAATHTWDNDMSFTLMSPTGTSLDLSSGNGSSSDDYVSTILDDAASSAVTSGSAPFRGRYRPEAALTGVNGQAASGSWSLKVTDGASGDTGSLRSWFLGLCVQ